MTIPLLTAFYLPFLNDIVKGIVVICSDLQVFAPHHTAETKAAVNVGTINPNEKDLAW